MPLTEESIPQAEAANLTRSETTFTDGREVRSVCQQSSSSFQTLSESPSSSAFSGFEGLSPAKTLKTTSDPVDLPNGNVPVRTYKVGINMRTHWISRGMHLVHYHSHRIYVGLLRRYALVQSEPRWNKELWCHEISGPSTCFYFGRLHFKAWVMYNGHEPEVREACRNGVGIRDQDVSLNNNMSRVREILTERLTPFKSPCTILAL